MSGALQMAWWFIFSPVSRTCPGSAAFRFSPAFLLSSGLSMPYHLTLDPATARPPCSPLRSARIIACNISHHTKSSTPLAGSPLPASCNYSCFYTKSVDFAYVD